MIKRDIKSLLESEDIKLTKDDIERILEAELEKDVEDIDESVIDACMFALTGALPPETEKNEPAEKKNKKPVKNPLKSKTVKTLLVAAIVLALAASLTICAGAAVDNSLFTDVVEFVKNGARIDWSAGPETPVPESTVPREDSKLYKDLVASGIEEIYLPSALYSKEKYTLTDLSNSDSYYTEVNVDGEPVVIEVEPEEKIIENCVSIAFSGKKIALDITEDKHFSMAEEMIGDNIALGNFTATDKINVNGVDIYLFESYTPFPRKKQTYIMYKVGTTEYRISIMSPIEEAKELLKEMG